MCRRGARPLGRGSGRGLRDFLRPAAQCRAVAGSGVLPGRGAEGPPRQAGRRVTPTPLGGAEIAARTDTYFNRTRAIVEKFGDVRVTYAIFLRRPVVSA